ncbi:MAG: four helix bundle suffix domain-containing protein [Muribaculaceae bacterium]|nr:four helix bundle suffix domain-containing protein [Muribaculaceae bacterium]
MNHDNGTNNFLPQRGNYRGLISYRKAECIYDITFYFANKFFQKGDRTIDQMVQAARSGKQNIAEGSAASSTSRETEIKLTNVAKASLQELLTDYEDYLRVRGMVQWPEGDPRLEKTREIGRRHNDSAYYREAITSRSDETIANIAIVLIKQEDYLLYRLIERLKHDFLEHGGIREEMSRARREHRDQEKRGHSGL